MGCNQSKEHGGTSSKTTSSVHKGNDTPQRTKKKKSLNNDTTSTKSRTHEARPAATPSGGDDQTSLKSIASSSSKKSSKKSSKRKSANKQQQQQQQQPQQQQQQHAPPSKASSITTATASEREELTTSLRRQHSDSSSLRSSLKPPVRKFSTNANGVAAGKSKSSSSESLWQLQWESFGSHQIIDPADVHSVLEELVNKTTNQLSPHEITFIQRRVRMIVRNLVSKDSSSTKSNTKMLKTFLSGTTSSSSNHKNNGGGGGGGMGNPGDVGVMNTIADSRAIAEKRHLLDELVLRRIFNAGQCVMRNCLTTSTAAATATTAAEPPHCADFIGSTFCLLQSLSRNWDRVASIAQDSATKNGLTMDVNKTIKPDNKEKHIVPGLPVSSIASDPNEDSPPAGVTMWSLCFLMAMALRGSREQRLHLLFYLMVPPKQLYQFLANHPAGGIPTFLLEVGNDTVLSVPSLAHYHYYGKSFLPSTEEQVLQTMKETRLSPPINTSSRKVPTISSQCMIDSIAILLTAHDTAAATPVAKSDNGSEDETAASAATSTTTIEEAVPSQSQQQQQQQQPHRLNSQQSRQSSSGYGFGLKRRGSDTNLRRRGSDNNLKKTAAAGYDAATMSESDLIHSNNTGGPKSQVMDYLQQLRENPTGTSYKDPALEVAYQTFVDHSSNPQWNTEHQQLTIDEYHEWAKEALEDAALDAIYHRIFATGILPSPSAERELVLKRWMDWQNKDAYHLWSDEGGSGEGATILDYFSPPKVMTIHDETTAPPPFEQEKDRLKHHDPNTDLVKVWGGIGGYDGRAGLGHGTLYCVDKKWWDSWEAYVGWNWDGCHVTPLSSSRKRPGDLSSERILDRQSDSVVAGTLGSYEIMKFGLHKGVHYVLVPPSVWDILYEIYGGGPPIPRMVLPLVKVQNRRERTFSTDSKQMEEEDMSVMSVEVVATDNEAPLRIPEAIQVATHPWIFHCHVCDASQPYRRGDAGSMSIRIMTVPDQPLWRLFAEVVVRLSVSNTKAFNAEGLGKARLWRRIEISNNAKDASTRYGPWSLVCKNRFAMLPHMQQNPSTSKDFYNDLREDWEAYADHATLESVGMTNNDRLMLEYAVVNKTGDFVWPREAAAKAGRLRHLAEDDLNFKRMLRGVDKDDKPLENHPRVAGTTIDAMDSTGRWYQVEISEIRNNEISESSEEDEEEMDMGNNVAAAGKSRQIIEVRQVRINFMEHGGHIEWIDVESDRLAIAGRFTLGKETTNGDASKASGPPDGKAKQSVAVKKGTTEPEPNGGSKRCTFPGYGACGLVNLGNTCYANSALQCISYMPLLRAYLLSSQYKTTGDLNKDNPLGTGGKLLEEFSDLLRIMWSGKYGEKSPTRFRGHLGRARSQFSGADQQDAQELLNYMLDVLHEDSNKVKKKPYVEALEDDWVKKTSLPRVGQEAWRRFLRRNRSIIADVAMGQVLNTVACPKCHFSSRNFDPFNLLSLPFPTVADVIFEVTVFRRGTSLNCPQTLNRTKKGDRRRERFERKKPTDGILKAPSNQLIEEKYAIAMSRLADIGDLRMQLQNISGISAGRLKLCKVEELVISQDMDDSNPVKTYIKVTGLPDKEGPCVKVANTDSEKEEDGAAPPSPTKIVAFESTLAPRPIQSIKQQQKEAADEKKEEDEEIESATASEDEESDGPGGLAGDAALHRSPRETRLLKELLDVYGDSRECRIYDSDPLPISKAISRCLWPQTEKDFKLGLRVDAIDHRSHWFPGSVVEIIEGVAASENGEVTKNSTSSPIDTDTNTAAATETKVRIHFDNFSSKWDETYTIEQFIKGQVRPLYSHATPRVKPTEFMVHHRYTDRSASKTNGGATNALFGQAFYLQCQNEWSTARAGAHILAQASRFLVRLSSSDGGDGTADSATVNKVKRIYEKISGTISDLIDILIDFDRRYALAALGTDEEVPFDEMNQADSFRNPSFDSSSLSAALIEKVRSLLHKLPFEVRVCTADAPLGTSSSPGKAKDAPSNQSTSSGSNNDEVPFPFSLMRTIGNFMNARHAVILHWRDPPVEKKSNSKAIHYFTNPVMYIRPKLATHKSSLDLLEDPAKTNKNNNRNGTNSPGGSAGLHLGVCLTEFCKQQQLHLTDCWRCPRCKEYREGKQNMQVWRLPDLLVFHIKRFNCSARWREKITTKINFPLTGLDMSEWCHSDSPVMTEDTEDSYVYDLIGVMNHYGGMTGGHYVAMCKATACGNEGSEEVAYDFNGAGASFYDLEEESGTQTGWRLGRSKDKEAAVNQSKVAAANASKGVSESAEPLWLQFDDELVEPIPPRNVVSEMAYVLFYRRRRITPSNIAKYSTLD